MYADAGTLTDAPGSWMEVMILIVISKPVW
jgi:hypothetical protein